MHDTVVPVAYVTHRDDEAFAALNHSLVKFLERIPGIKASSIVTMNSLDTTLDNAELYSPSAELSVVQMNRIANEVAQNLTLEGRVMDASWKQYPQGKFSNIDAFRHLQATIVGFTSALADAHSEDDPEVLPQANASEIAHYGNVAQVVRELRLQGKRELKAVLTRNESAYLSALGGF